MNRHHRHLHRHSYARGFVLGVVIAVTGTAALTAVVVNTPAHNPDLFRTAELQRPETPPYSSVNTRKP